LFELFDSRSAVVTDDDVVVTIDGVSGCSGVVPPLVLVVADETPDWLKNGLFVPAAVAQQWLQFVNDDVDRTNQQKTLTTYVPFGSGGAAAAAVAAAAAAPVDDAKDEADSRGDDSDDDDDSDDPVGCCVAPEEPRCIVRSDETAGDELRMPSIEEDACVELLLLLLNNAGDVVADEGEEEDEEEEEEDTTPDGEEKANRELELELAPSTPLPRLCCLRNRCSVALTLRRNSPETLTSIAPLDARKPSAMP